MTEKERSRAEEVKKYGIDAMLNGLYLYCHNGDCRDCFYFDETKEACNVLDRILEIEDFPSADEVPYGDREN